MPLTCSIFDCKVKKGENVSLFLVPKDKFEEWKSALAGKTKKPLNPKSAVCERQFRAKEIQTHHSISVGNGEFVHQLLANY